MPGKYSIIFMHDDGRSRRWRMKLTTARALLAIMIILPLLAGGSLWLNWHLLRTRMALHEQIADLRISLDKQAQTTTRLASLEQYLGRRDPDKLSTLGIAASGETLRLTALSPLPAKPDPLAVPAAAPAGEEPASSSAGAATDATDTADAGAPALADSAQAAAGDAPAGEGGEGVVPGEIHTEVLTEAPLDKGMVRVENLSARQVGARSLRISFDLYNNERVATLSGRAAFDLVMPDGRLYPLSSQGDTAYRINNMKRISGNPTLPAEVSDVTGAMIRVNVLADEELVYRLLIPLQQ